MNRRQHSGVFLMEMIAVVFFFILCTTICIQTFVKADQLSQKASDLNQGVLIAQSVAEVWKAEGLEGLEKQFGAVLGEKSTKQYLIGFDHSGNPCKEDNAVFLIDAQMPALGQLNIIVTRKKHEVYRLSVIRQEIDD